jgi:hypothetical protein
MADNAGAAPLYCPGMKILTRNGFLSALGCVAFSAAQAQAQGAESVILPDTLATLPIREITVFKDGHAFVAHEGEMPTDPEGNVVMDHLPSPVIGTFWPYAVEPRARLSSVVAGQRRVAVDHTALNLRELLEANIGTETIITELGKDPYHATILAVPAARSEGDSRTLPPPMTNVSPGRWDGGAPPVPTSPREKIPEKGTIILLKTVEGSKALPLDRIQDVTFKRDHKAGSPHEEVRNLLTLKLDWGITKPASSARVGLFYLQKGVRWIPSYKVDLDGEGNALVKMQATLVNELADLEDVSINLVVGVPTFAFKDTMDPMGLQHGIAQLSAYFQSENNHRNSPVAYQFSNAIMSQTARMGDYRPAMQGGDSGGAGPDIADSGQSEDLFVFRLEHVTLRRGERVVLPVAEFTLPYQDVFTVDLPFAPPPEMRGSFNSDQQRELARLFSAPKAMHKVRLTNNSNYPLTTAPALILRDGGVLAQGMMTYTARGASADLTITTALNIQAKKNEAEIKRTPNAVQENGNSYTRIDLNGEIRLTNHRSQAAELEVTRLVLGAIDTAEHKGKVEKLNAFENGDYLAADDYPYWWGWYNWPYWWNQFNGVTRITWKVTMEPGQMINLEYQWHYFWR